MQTLRDNLKAIGHDDDEIDGVLVRANVLAGGGITGVDNDFVVAAAKRLFDREPLVQPPLTVRRRHHIFHSGVTDRWLDSSKNE